MKRFIFFILLLSTSLLFANDDSFEIEKLITEIQGVGSPYVKKDYAIFTAESNVRFTGIAFDFEGFRNIHSYQKLITYDSDNKPIDSLMFTVVKLPQNCRRVAYRLVIDGLWTTDPENPQKEYDSESGLWFSILKIDKPLKYQTEVVKEDSNLVTFVYLDSPGQIIRLSGTFTNWDSFIYQLSEVAPGRYEITIPLPSGTYYYNFYKGLTSYTDQNNTPKVYTPEGRIASVITVK